MKILPINYQLPTKQGFISAPRMRKETKFLSEAKGFISAPRMRKERRPKAFTLIELLVVITIIGLLAGIGIASYTRALTRGRVARAQADLNSLKTAMLMYYTDVGELPPRGDNCSACSNPPNSSWTLVINALMSNDGSGWSGPYLDKRADKDPWDNYYGYDDNAGVCCGYESYIRSAGPDKALWTGDDIHMTVMRDND